MRCLVTGGSGFIGGHLLRRLRDAGHAITTIGRTPVMGDHILLDQLDASRIEAAIHGREFDVLFHLAAAGVKPDDRNEEVLRYINADLPPQLINLCAEYGIKKFIMTGSCSEYADDPSHELRHEDAKLETVKLYGSTKAIGGLRAIDVANATGVIGIVLRLFKVYGPGEASHRLVPTLWAKAKTTDRIALSQGTQQCDFVYVGDACNALIAAADHQGIKTGIYNICSGQAHSVRTFIELMCTEIGIPIERADFGAIPMRPDEVMYFAGNPQKFADAVGWRTTTDLSSGIRMTVQSLSGRKQ